MRGWSSRWAAILLLCSVACGDRSPPALWPEPPPPALAEPIGVADPASAEATPPSKTVGDPKVEAPPPKPAEAKQEQ